MVTCNYADYQEPTLREAISIAKKLGCSLSVQAGCVLLAPSDDGAPDKPRSAQLLSSLGLSWVWQQDSKENLAPRENKKFSLWEEGG